MTRHEMETEISRLNNLCSNDCYNHPDNTEFNDIIDECTDDATIMGLTYVPSQVLFDTDPIAYRTCFNDYCNTRIAGLECDLQEMEN